MLRGLNEKEIWKDYLLLGVCVLWGDENKSYGGIFDEYLFIYLFIWLISRYWGSFELSFGLRVGGVEMD